MITIDTESTLYVCTDGTNGEVHIIAPERAKYGVYKHIEHLRLDDPDPYGPYGNDVAVYKLLCESNMDRNTFLI